VTQNRALHAHLVLASRFENIEVAERALNEICEQVGIEGDELYWVVTALREALANAVRHGNKAEPERKVKVDCSVEDGNLKIRIEDEGEGFDPESIPDPTDPENLLRPSGRGIFYMQQFMNRVEFSRTPAGGTAVLMIRDLQTDTRSTDDEE
jgi:serine/threonine-protein kinase RsbW